jgi:CRISPR-associated protein Cas1
MNAVGLEPSVGFLHEFVSYQTKQSLVYDLQEPFRWISDVSMLEAFESRELDLHDFYFTTTKKERESRRTESIGTPTFKNQSKVGYNRSPLSILSLRRTCTS